MYLVCLDRRECRSSLDSFDQLKFGGTYRDCGPHQIPAPKSQDHTNREVISVRGEWVREADQCEASTAMSNHLLHACSRLPNWRLIRHPNQPPHRTGRAHLSPGPTCQFGDRQPLASSCAWGCARAHLLVPVSDRCTCGEQSEGGGSHHPRRIFFLRGRAIV
jgi:hypothetical protein